MTVHTKKLKHDRAMERTALARYPQLLQRLGSRAEALEVICGVFRAGDMRPAFFEHAFGRQILDEAERLSAEHGPGWRERFASLSGAEAFIRTGQHPRHGGRT